MCDREGGGVDIIALVQTPVPEALVFKLEREQLGELAWEGQRVLIGRPAVLLAALRRRQYDVVIALSIEYSILTFALELPATARYATPHNYYLPPFGPFRRFPVRDGHAALLQRLDALLSPCEHHCEYLQRWGPPGLVTRPLFAADYHYFHRAAAAGGGLAEAMCPWEAAHKYVTFVSPAPEKGLAVFVALARRMPSVAFAAVVTQWTGAQTLARLRPLPNVTVLAADPDVDVVFRQTRVLLAPSLWQECCPLIVMEACLRGVPCVSSDVFGLPEANSNPRLVVPAALSYDHARGTLHHGLTNAQLEHVLGAHPALPSDTERSAAIVASTAEEATPEEVAPFEATLRALLEDEKRLRRESHACRSTFLAFARAHEGGLHRELAAVAARRPPAAAASELWVGGMEAARQAGYRLQTIERPELQQASRGGGARSDEPVADAALPAALDASSSDAAAHALPLGATYRVVHAPFVFLRTAPATDAQVHAILPAGTTFEVDALRHGWVRTAAPSPPVAGGAPRQAWALVDGAEVGLGVLLEPAGGAGRVAPSGPPS